MADVIDILKSSGPISLDELNLRTSESPTDLVVNLTQLEKLGLVSVSGPKENALRELTSEQVENASDVVIELTNSAMRRLTR